jgi:hypothetical protein
MAGANLTTHLPILQVLEKAGTTPYSLRQLRRRSKQDRLYNSMVLVMSNSGMVLHLQQVF